MTHDRAITFLLINNEETGLNLQASGPPNTEPSGTIAGLPWGLQPLGKLATQGEQIRARAFCVPLAFKERGERALTYGCSLSPSTLTHRTKSLLLWVE